MLIRGAVGGQFLFLRPECSRIERVNKDLDNKQPTQGSLSGGLAALDIYLPP